MTSELDRIIIDSIKNRIKKDGRKATQTILNMAEGEILQKRLKRAYGIAIQELENE